MTSLQERIAAAAPVGGRWTRVPPAVAVAFVAGALGEAGLAWAAFSAPRGRSLPLLVGLWSLAWLVAVRAAFGLPRRAAIGAIVVVGVALRLIALAGPPTTSDDLFRYSWDGRVQAAGIDPYAQPPVASQLAGLREPWLWPDTAGCAALARGPGCTRINRENVRTIYPPVAEAWFATVYRVAGIGARHKAWQVAGLLTELVTLGLLVVALGRWGRDPRWAAIYVLCPAPVIELVNNGHVDGLAIALILGALIVALPPDGSQPPPWRDVAAAALLGLAFLVKLYPAVVALPLVVCRPRGQLRALWRVAATMVVLTGVAYAPHVARVGSRVLGYLPGYLREEHYQGGGRYLIANLVGIPHAWDGLASLLGIAVVVGWIVARRPALPVASSVLVAAVVLAGSPAQPWYAVTLLALATLAARPALVAVVAAGYVASFASLFDQHGAATIGGCAYTAALAVVVIGAIGRRLLPPAATTLTECRHHGDGDGRQYHRGDNDNEVGAVVVGE